MNKLVKPVGSTWTDEQWRAISERGNNILVAAAAGSGKTAVLVERIIRRIADEKEETDVDRLLVVTFTKAAASEMKGRIREKLEEELSKNPYSRHLRKQLLLLTRASISTLHSFCMEVVKRYTYQLDLDPAFRVADDLEAKLLRQDVMDALFEEEYKQADAQFFALVDAYSSDRSDAQLQQLVLRLYDFAQSHPWPAHWLDTMAELYEVEVGISFESLPWIQELQKPIEMDLLSAIDLLRSALNIAKQPGGPAPYIENFEDYLLQFEQAYSCRGNWDKLQAAVCNIQFGRLNSCKKNEFDEGLIEQAKAFRDRAKDIRDALMGKYFSQSPAAIVEDLQRLAPVMRALVELVKKFGLSYHQAKREKGIVDFADLEHYCLQLLRHQDSTPEQLIPSEIALQYRQQFAEILVDEYQDTNHVQESLLTLIARDGEGGGNRFIVGDVKQSIYRFRLTEPKLFLDKYNRYSPDGNDAGIRIDLAKNFRSRAEVLSGTNFVFRQIMHEDVAEINYDQQAELVLGANYPALEHNPIELQLIDRNTEDRDQAKEAFDSDTADDEQQQGSLDGIEEFDPEEYENIQLEARLIASRIRDMISSGYMVSERSGQQRRLQYRDIVILLRSTNRAAPLMLEEFRLHNIPAYAEVSGGYFAATEIEILLSLLRIIDNPYQDIPLAAVLRSPMVQLDAEELAQLRLYHEQGSYYDALQTYLHLDTDIADQGLQERLQRFYDNLQAWRAEARQGALSELIWNIYQQTGYYDFAGSLPGGRERQANLRALYDRARQFEASAFRGLYRFLRFVERMQDRGEEMGVARALGEQEDVIRIMTIHKSKGLEFPVVFIANLAKPFNMMDIHGGFLYHKELGFGSKWVDTEQRVTYPTLPLLAIKRRQLLELLAEEERLLYVAMTRAKEKLILVGTVKNLAKSVERWSAALAVRDWQLPPHMVATSRTYLDWIGPALIRHPDAVALTEQWGDIERPHTDIANDPSTWSFTILKADQLRQSKENESAVDIEKGAALRELRPIAGIATISAELVQRLEWSYAYPLAARNLAKQSVSEIKRRWQHVEAQEEPTLQLSIQERPRFMEEKGLTTAERGTAMHMVMQQLDLAAVASKEGIEQQVQQMVERELLTLEQAHAIDIELILGFFAGDVGQRMLRAKQLLREIPFSYALPAQEVYGAEWTEQEGDEQILIQGIIDLLIEEEDGWLLIDYKTDRTAGLSDEALADRYQVQLELYQRAIEAIWKRPLKGKVLYFFDGGRTIYSL